MILVYEQHQKHCLLFAFQLKKTAAEVEQMIRSALSGDAFPYITIKKWFQRFKSCGNLDFVDVEGLDQLQKVENE